MEILLFGVAKDIIGSSMYNFMENGSDKTNLPKTVGELRLALIEKFPKLANLSSIAIAVNNAYAEDETILRASDEVALIPPVSGG